MAIDAGVLGWLLDSDPALRWQVERDLAGLPPSVWKATRARVATEGWGSTLLAEQDADGQWAGGAYFPAGFFGSAEAEQPGQPWVATTWTLRDLREWGLDAGVLAGTADKLAANSRWEYDDLPYWGGEVDVCINSYTLASGAWLGADVSALAAWFPAHRLADGGWNCEAEEGDSVRSSFHSTLNAVRGLLAYEMETGDTAPRDARHSGEEYLLTRRLMYRVSTGEPVGDFVSQFVYPNRHRYSALAALDHFRDVSLWEGTPPDARLADAVAAVRAARQPDGTWLQGTPLPGRTWFDIDAAEGEPSRWLTFLGTRVLDWWKTTSAESIGRPLIVDRETWEVARAELLLREKAHTREGDAIAAARRRLPMVEFDPTVTVVGPDGPVPFLALFEGRDELLVYKHMWWDGAPHQGQCEGCTFAAWQLRDAVYLNARGVSFAILTAGPWNEVAPYLEFMGYAQPWYSVRGVPSPVGRNMGEIASFLRDGDRAFLTYSTTGRGNETFESVPALLDMTPFGRGETWEEKPATWPDGHHACWYWRTDANGESTFGPTGRPTPQWTRPGAGRATTLGRTGMQD